ncbi:hypothetical protein NWF32_17185 [Pseudomonas qingdaonensis]|nr:hypothetical protein [Pseudomonas qingdaonensis]
MWVRLEWQYAQNKAVVRRRFSRQFQVDSESVPALAVFEVGSDGWDGITTSPRTPTVRVPGATAPRCATTAARQAINKPAPPHGFMP